MRKRNIAIMFPIMYSKEEEDSKNGYWNIGSHRTGNRKK